MIFDQKPIEILRKDHLVNTISFGAVSDFVPLAAVAVNVYAFHAKPLLLL